MFYYITPCPVGIPELRQAICHFHQRYDSLTFDPEQVLVAPGSKELIYLTMSVFNGGRRCVVYKYKDLLYKKIIFIQNIHKRNSLVPILGQVKEWLLWIQNLFRIIFARYEISCYDTNISYKFFVYISINVFVALSLFLCNQIIYKRIFHNIFWSCSTLTYL